MYSYRRVYYRANSSGTSWITKAGANVVSPPDARVCQATIAQHLENFLLFRLYPSVATLPGSAIGAGRRIGAIQKPAEIEDITPEDEISGYKGARPVTGSLASRAPRVVGSFDHPLLPMPPVRR